MMYDCEISNLRKVSLANSQVVDPANYDSTLSNDYVWKISVKTENFSGVVDLATGTVPFDELITAFRENGINLPLAGVTQARVATQGSLLIGLVGPNDEVVKPNFGIQR